ncbi:MAG TPA: winged helix-turn-helix domain-containing protein, partial [Candidatus Binataceae bacterium]
MHRKVASFSPFEFDAQTTELRKHGLRLKLPGQPAQVLQVLIERAGEVVTREELQKLLWPAETYGDFDQGLNTAIKRLRAALGDSAQTPRFIETVARRGYRFIAPVQFALPVQFAIEDVPADRRQPDPGLTPAPSPAPFRRFRLLTIAGVVIAVAGLIVWSYSRRVIAQSAPIRSLAVLPLANLSGPDQDYFVDGMADALRQKLQLIKSVRVISRTSSMHYSDNRKALPDVAHELNVDAVVEGAVQRSGNRLMLSIALTRVEPERRIWSNTFESDVEDVLALEATLAGRIADEIKVNLASPDRARLMATRRVDPAAYLAYARGRQAWNKRSQQDLT